MDEREALGIMFYKITSMYIKWYSFGEGLILECLLQTLEQSIKH